MAHGPLVITSKLIRLIDRENIQELLDSSFHLESPHTEAD